jgi:cold shock protein
MAGTIARWLGGRGFGFIRPATGDADMFVHARALVGGMTELREGDRVTFDEEPDPKAER